MKKERRYFIYDCNKKVVGRTYGYATHKGAEMALKASPKMRRYLWDTYDFNLMFEPNCRIVYAIQSAEV